ncbi:hypothetical protein QAD02_009405 [Eretmocerus hayati]|uniref:Uncharacterized protein n=1 Tax=Eretmocerus hayati TaxID=131215 RepID=A0ACC2N9B0_9HYME|nr:hypothetical protein QAD02_009405 [Eretmocerus hayati]
MTHFQLFVSDCYLAWGRRLNVPLVGIKTTALSSWHNEALGNPVNLAVQPGAGSRFFGPMGFWQRLANFLQNLVVSGLFKQHIRADQNDIVERLFGKGYPDVVAMQRDLDLVLVNSHSSLNGLTPTVPSIVHVAGMHIDDGDGNGSKLPEEVQKWLDDSKDGCIYFSFGSMIRIETFPEPIMRVFYTSLESIAPVRVLMKVARPQELPFSLPSNVMTQSWFSQVQVLKHKNVKAFITHGGMMSAQEAIYTGVPMIGISIFGDQHLNVQANVERGIAIAVKLHGITEEKLTYAIKEIIQNKLYREKAEKLSKLFNDRPMKPLDAAVFWVEYIARHGKKALRSPIVDMPWFQAKLLDVYAFLLIIGFIIFSILRTAYDKVYSLLRLPVKKSSRSKSKSKKYRWYQQLLLKTSPECSLYSFMDD